MKPNKDKFSIVIAGGWNKKIFTPKWLKQYICSDQNSDITFALPINNPDAGIKIDFEGNQLFLLSSRLEIKPSDFSKDSFLKSSEVAQKILDTLSHTPINAVGLNLSFSEADTYDYLNTKFQLGDTADIDVSRYKTETYQIRRVFSFENNTKLNLVIEDIDGNKFTFDFNYHTEIENAAEAKDILSHQKVDDLWNHSQNLLKDIYKVENYEETVDEED